MEPLPKERSDGYCCLGISAEMALPQWSRSRRSGATRSCPDMSGRVARAGLNGAAPEGAERRRLRRHRSIAFCTASMEPLPKERSDRGSDFAVGEVDVSASMEPLPKERSDADGVTGARARRASPQWSRSRRSGATRSECRTYGTGALPQWSRSRRSGATRMRTIDDLRPRRPQWSRSRRSGATNGPLCARREVPGCLNGAAPEGAERRALSSARPLLAHAGLNGAAPEGAERHHVTSSAVAARDQPQWSRSRRSGATDAGQARGNETTPPQWSRSRRSGATGGHSSISAVTDASMEPLPKERSDPRSRNASSGGHGPQWSRSRRSGATARQKRAI